MELYRCLEERGGELLAFETVSLYSLVLNTVYLWLASTTQIHNLPTSSPCFWISALHYYSDPFWQFFFEAEFRLYSQEIKDVFKKMKFQIRHQELSMIWFLTLL